MEEVKAGIQRALAVVSAEGLWIEPDCGLKTRTPDEVRDKLRVMVTARDEVRRELAS